MINTNKYYSSCCYARMPGYPDNDFCPKCGEHAEGHTEEEYEAEEGCGKVVKMKNCILCNTPTEAQSER
jgi:hypothetical protein